MSKNTATIQVGRLVEIRSYAGYRSVKDVEEIFEEYGAVVNSLPPHEKIVTIVDHRHAPMLSREAAGYMSERLNRVNPRTLRAATMIPPETSPTAVQYTHIVRAAGGSSRRVFSDIGACIGWLSEVLSTAERQRLIRFLDEGEHSFNLDTIAAAAQRTASPCPPRR